jgi:hypothetical protein
LTASFPLKPSPSLSRFLAVLAVSVLFGLGWFLLLHGRYPLYFSHVDWIYSFGSDTLQHHLGWEWFRQDPWSFPLGRIQSYGYPFGTFLSYLDSIPLFAIPFKVLSPLLGARFQYLGLWELTSVIMQFLMGMLILGEFTRSYPLRIVGASLLVLSPPMILRTFHHNSLTAQWILLAGIWFILLEYRHRLWRWAWPALFGVAMLVHLYYAAMLLPLWGVGLYFRYSRGKLSWQLGVDILVVTGVLLLTAYSIGLFSLDTGDLVKFGFGLYSWNLNGLVNPLQYSSILSELAVVSDRQHEGFSYLGLGNLFILPTAVFLFLQNDWSRRRLYFFLPLALAALLYCIYALSQKAFIGLQPIWDMDVPEFLFRQFSLFRASGRFIWPVFYLVVLFGMISVLRNYRWPALVLGLALVLQYIDLQPLIAIRKFDSFSSYASPMQADFWQQAAQTNRHVILLPASQKASSIYEPPAIYASRSHMTLNTGYFARADYAAIEQYGNQVWQDLQAGKADDDTLYIIWEAEWIEQARQTLADKMLLCQVDGYTVALSAENKLAQSGFDLPASCSVPAND